MKKLKWYHLAFCAAAIFYLVLSLIDIVCTPVSPVGFSVAALVLWGLLLLVAVKTILSKKERERKWYYYIPAVASLLLVLITLYHLIYRWM